MRILLVTPAPPGSRKGNRITALRWARLLRQLGHRVAVRQEYGGERPDVLIALHARRSFDAVEAFRRAHAERPIIVALTGTDLYGDIHIDANAKRSLEIASRLVLLQSHGVSELPPRLRHKARVIYQSTEAPRAVPRPREGIFEVCVLGHLRPVKDPFRTACAARLLPTSSHMRVLQVGGALSTDMAEQAAAELAANPRYRWLGDLPRWRALRVLARCRLLVLTSRMEGGANVISEAIASGVPVLSSRISGSLGILGPDYPGYFPVGDTRALAALLSRAEMDPRFYRDLKTCCRRLRPLVDPARERRSWQHVLRELSSGFPTSPKR
jgi:putative glycosyltransferase (TIGR04348 family)